MPGFNLSSLADEASSEDAGTLIHVNDVNGEPAFYGSPEKRQPVTMLVAGALSPTFRKAERAFNARSSKRARGGDGLARLLDRRAIETSADCVLSWDGFFTDATESRALELTAENVIAVFEAAPYVLAQVVVVMHEHANFLPTKPGS